MALTVESVGTLVAAASGDVSVAYPAGIAAGDLLLENVATKWITSSHGTPSGFDFVDGDSAGSGAESGTDSGTSVGSVFSRIASGSEVGSVTQPITNGDGGVLARMARISRSGGTGFALSSTTARWTAYSTNPISVTTDDSLDLAPGDLLWVLLCINTDRPSTVSTAVFSAAGITFGTPTIAYGETSLGGDSAMAVIYVPIDSGTATGPVSLDVTKVSSDSGAGPLIFVRIREAVGGGSIDGSVLLTLAGTTSTITGTTTILTNLASLLEDATSNITVTSTVIGHAGVTLADTTSTISGTVGTIGTTGTVASTLDNTTLSSSGTTTVLLILANTLENTQSNINTTPTVVGQVTLTLDDTTSAIFVLVGDQPDTTTWRTLTGMGT